MYRLPSDVLGELMHVLVGDPGVVGCDLTGMAPWADGLENVLAPATSYLRQWPGSILVLCPPSGSSPVFPAALADRLLVRACPEAGVAEARLLLRPLHQETVRLPPAPTAPRDARETVARLLREWRLQRLVWTTSLVTSELVTHSVEHAHTLIELTLSRVDTQVRIAVRDRGGGRPETPETIASPDVEADRGLLLVQVLTRGWGVVPARGPGKTVWAVIGAARRSGSRAAEVPPRR